MTHAYMAQLRGRTVHIQRSKFVAMCGWAPKTFYEPQLMGLEPSNVCPKCLSIVGHAAVVTTAPAPEDMAITGRWEIELMGSPPRQNQLMRGKAPKNMHEAAQAFRQRMALQGVESDWKKRTAMLLKEKQVPTGLGFVRVSAVFYRANPDSGDDQGDVSALKAITDGIVAYGCVPDDSRRFLATTIPQSKKRPAGQRRNSVRIIIEQLCRRP